MSRKTIVLLTLGTLIVVGCGTPPPADVGTVTFIDIAGEIGAGVEQPRLDRVGRYATQLRGGAALDVYFPDGDPVDAYPVMVYLQGANIDYRSYTTYASRVAAYGFVVAVPNRRTALGLFASLDDVPDIRDLLAVENDDADSPLFGRVDSATFALGGHSFGGAASLDAAGDVCRFPFCGGSLDRSGLAAVVTFGANRCTDDACTDVAIDTMGVPVQMIQGDSDTVAPPTQGRTTFDAISGATRQFVTIVGADHVGHLDLDEPATQPLDQTTSIETTARWTGLFLLAFVQNDDAARASLDTLPDDNVEQELLASP